jgi:hypothetical protein
MRVETKGRGGVWRRQVQKGSRSLRRVPLRKAAPPLKPAMTMWKPKGSLTPGPHLSPPMTGGPRPLSQRCGRWRWGEKRNPNRQCRGTGPNKTRSRTVWPAERGWRATSRESHRGGEGPSCPLTVGTGHPPCATLGYGPTCRFVPHRRWARGPLSLHMDRGTSC